MMKFIHKLLEHVFYSELWHIIWPIISATFIGFSDITFIVKIFLGIITLIYLYFLYNKLHPKLRPNESFIDTSGRILIYHIPEKPKDKESRHNYICMPMYNDEKSIEMYKESEFMAKYNNDKTFDVSMGSLKDTLVAFKYLGPKIDNLLSKINNKKYKKFSIIKTFSTKVEAENFVPSKKDICVEFNLEKYNKGIKRPSINLISVDNDTGLDFSKRFEN